MDFVYPDGCPLVTLFPPLKPLCKKVPRLLLLLPTLHQAPIHTHAHASQVVTGFSVCIFSMGSDFTGKSISMHGSTANARAAGKGLASDATQCRVQSISSGTRLQGETIWVYQGSLSKKSSECVQIICFC